MWKVVCRAFWLPDASNLTLYFTITCFMTSPNVAVLPSLPTFDKSMAFKVNKSVNTGALGIAGLIRAAAEEPQADVEGAFGEGAADARAGNEA